MFRDIPDHPDIESALRTGYPRSYGSSYDDYDEDAAYEERRERELFGDDC